jgi:uncharacterized membrane protein
MSRSPRDYPLLASDQARSWVCAVVFVAAYVAISVALGDRDIGDLRGYVIYLMAWTVFCAAYLAVVLGVFVRADGDTLARWLRATPRAVTRRQRIVSAVNGDSPIGYALSGAAAAVGAVTILVTSGARTEPTVLWAGVAALAASWAVIPVSFAVHYARAQALGGGLDFPGDAPPRFADHLYLAFQLSTTSGGSDVSITTTRMRRVVTLHSVLAYLFNTVIIAILVTVLLSAVS